MKNTKNKMLKYQIFFRGRIYMFFLIEKRFLFENYMGKNLWLLM